jgi:large subunit ribosomal protein L25
VRHEIEVECPATAIPDAFEIDLDGLDIGDSVHISHVSLPDGVTPTITDRDFTIATIAGAAAMKPEEDEEGEEAETEETEEEEEAEGEE